MSLDSTGIYRPMSENNNFQIRCLISLLNINNRIIYTYTEWKDYGESISITVAKKVALLCRARRFLLLETFWYIYKFIILREYCCHISWFSKKSKDVSVMLSVLIWHLSHCVDVASILFLQEIFSWQVFWCVVLIGSSTTWI